MSKVKEGLEENDRIAIEEIRKHEGARWVAQDENGEWYVTSKTSEPNGGTHLMTYRDSEGNLTSGFGHLVEDGENIPEIQTPEEAEVVFTNDYLHHKRGASRMPGWKNSSSQQQRGLVNLAFNMGPSWWVPGNPGGWEETPKAMAKGTKEGWREAAKGLKDSFWYEQVGGKKYDAGEPASSRGRDILNLISPKEEEEIELSPRYKSGGLIRDAYGRSLF